MKTGRNSKNAGFSLVELIVVIAIMVVLVGLVGLSMGIVTSRRVSKVASEMVSSIERARVLTLGKEQNQVECVVYYESGVYYAQIIQGGTEVSNRDLGTDPITVEVQFDDGTTSDLGNITGNSLKGASTTRNGLHILFNRASGAFVQETNLVGGAAKKYCTKVVISNGSRTAEVTLVGPTGKIKSK